MQSHTHEYIVICCEIYKIAGTVSVTGNVIDRFYYEFIILIDINIMKQIYEWALEQCGVNDTVIKAVSMLRSEQAERFVEVVVGCEINNDDIPQEFTYEGKVYKFVRANYVLDEITYRCEDSTTRYFKTQTDADKYAENGNYSWDESSSNALEEYPYKGVWTRECEHTTWYNRWFEWANKPM